MDHRLWLLLLLPGTALALVGLALMLSTRRPRAAGRRRVGGVEPRV